MLSKKTIHYLSLAVTLTSWCHSTPLKWNYDSNRLQLIKSRRKRILFYCSFALMIFYVLFLMGQVIRISLWVPPGKAKLSALISLGYNIFAYSIPLALQLTSYLRWNEFPNFINGFMDFFDLFQDTFGITQPKPTKNGCEKILKTFFIMGGLISVQNFVLIFKAPHRVFFLSSIVFQSGHTLPFYWKLPFVCVHAMIWLIIWSQMLFFGTMTYAYVFPVVFILREMNSKKSSELTKKSLRTSEMFIYVYRCLQVQQNIFNFCFKELFMPYHKVLLSVVAIFGIYGAVKLSPPRSIIMGLVAYTVMMHLSVLFRRLGQLWVTSDQVLLSWHGNASAKTQFFKRFLKSSTPLIVNISSYYIIKKTTVLNLWIVIINGSISLLLAT